MTKRFLLSPQYQEDLNELNEIARHRPRSALIMNLAQENSQIRELQQENKVSSSLSKIWADCCGTASRTTAGTFGISS